MNSDLNYIAQSFKDSVAELSKQNAQLTVARNSLKGISNIARDLVDFRKGENDLSEKQLNVLNSMLNEMSTNKELELSLTKPSK